MYVYEAYYSTSQYYWLSDHDYFEFWMNWKDKAMIQAVSTLSGIVAAAM
eukprot:CAMPEP_0170559848 /NCGR_PEP_ID=MMETSP0211-20121228/45405_1 /TAXON_ID=311385 /ORGANISM="Pseudokeronopsis sp., Strain OXSARD2" /LENGTH=48 /DNA_ID= /DNA_START= /DNA_END= /DNA_ORIENTATION=